MIHLLISAMLLFGSVTTFAHSAPHAPGALIQNTYTHNATPREMGNFRAPAAHGASQCLNTACEAQNIGPVSTLLPLPPVEHLAASRLAAGARLSGVTPDQDSPPPKITIKA
ncbi:hypothetical protein [Acidiphilium sp.]|uniref:hypothetical protein n=1 Tax=Acidiphilium sp. TaxID=527 RepID=UPI000BD59D32|nr:hypothetical protein [Acidiphilium sp.]OYV42308.1 MAG: hypothetical protein B7Z75_13375 [Acidocella sp. 20-57-95]OYV61848.1 MAG: hypothetical protein B7Z71_03610 [Acidocella sp. 21-58-7]HQT61915.1 hypothetical protein [Acidiphilium sp.]